MNKKELVASVAEKMNESNAQGKVAVNAIMAVIEETLAKGDKISLVGFGNFSVSERAERKGRNPKTGEKLTIKAKKVVKFKAGSRLEEIVNS